MQDKMVLYFLTLYFARSKNGQTHFKNLVKKLFEGLITWINLTCVLKVLMEERE